MYIYYIYIYIHIYICIYIIYIYAHTYVYIYTDANEDAQYPIGYRHLKTCRKISGETKGRPTLGEDQPFPFDPMYGSKGSRRARSTRSKLARGSLRTTLRLVLGTRTNVCLAPAMLLCRVRV